MFSSIQALLQAVSTTIDTFGKQASTPSKSLASHILLHPTMTGLLNTCINKTFYIVSKIVWALYMNSFVRFIVCSMLTWFVSNVLNWFLARSYAQNCSHSNSDDMYGVIQYLWTSDSSLCRNIFDLQTALKEKNSAIITIICQTVTACINGFANVIQASATHVVDVNANEFEVEDIRDVRLRPRRRL